MSSRSATSRRGSSRFPAASIRPSPRILAVKAIGADKIVGVRLPYRTSSPESLEHAQLVVDALGIECRTLDISPSVDGYLANEPDADAARRGNVMARVRMLATFDLGARYKALPLGTGNKTERLLGYFTWHGDDAPPVNPLGDLYKTQVRQLARYLGVPSAIVDKPPSADLQSGTDGRRRHGDRLRARRSDPQLDPLGLLARGDRRARVRREAKS